MLLLLLNIITNFYCFNFWLLFLWPANFRHNSHDICLNLCLIKNCVIYINLHHQQLRSRISLQYEWFYIFDELQTQLKWTSKRGTAITYPFSNSHDYWLIILKLRVLAHLVSNYVYVEAQNCNFYTLLNNCLILINVSGRHGIQSLHEAFTAYNVQSLHIKFADFRSFICWDWRVHTDRYGSIEPFLGFVEYATYFSVYYMHLHIVSIPFFQGYINLKS